MVKKTKAKARAKAAPADFPSTDAAALAQISADLGALAAFLADLPGVESSLAAKHEAVREIARRRNA